jgi:hypothetical protein
MTRYSAALASTSRLALACAFGLRLDNFLVQRVAGQRGSTSTLLKAHEQGMPWTTDVCLGALQSRSLPKLQWLVEEQGCPLHANAAPLATFLGSVDVLASLKQRGAALNLEALGTVAADAGHWHVLQYLRSEGMQWSAALCDAAASQGRLQLLTKLREHGCPCDENITAIMAAVCGQLSTLQWLKEQGVAISADALKAAVQGGHVTVVQYLVAEGHQLSSELCTIAAQHDCVKTLHWLLAQHCSWSLRSVCLAAAHGGSTHVLAYLWHQPLVHLQLGAQPLTAMLNAAGANNKLAAAQWLRQQGAEWPAVLQYAYTVGQLKQWRGSVLEWARTAGCTSPLQ